LESKDWAKIFSCRNSYRSYRLAHQFFIKRPSAKWGESNKDKEVIMSVGCCNSFKSIPECVLDKAQETVEWSFEWSFTGGERFLGAVQAVLISITQPSEKDNAVTTIAKKVMTCLLYTLGFLISLPFAAAVSLCDGAKCIYHKVGQILCCKERQDAHDTSPDADKDI
jgi:hypothetical protein